MKTVLFYHSLVSAWNHGNAHFLRGIATELQEQGHSVEIYEPENGWSYRNMLKDEGEEGLASFMKAFPHLKSTFYNPATINLEKVLKNADLVIVHEWTDPELVNRIGQLRQQADFALLFHDTHHRAVSKPEEMQRYDLSHYDGALVFGESLKKVYHRHNWAKNVWVWHEAADTRTFKPVEARPEASRDGDLVWVGNWGDGERSDELREFILEPVEQLGLSAMMYGVRYPDQALQNLEGASIGYGGYLPSHKVPGVFARYRFTVHVPRCFYRQQLPGIPTIRPFEALACRIPLICASWQDSEGLFEPGKDFLMVNDGKEMKEAVQELLHYPEKAEALAAHGYKTLQKRHTCAHRVKELLQIVEGLHQHGAPASAI